MGAIDSSILALASTVVMYSLLNSSIAKTLVLSILIATKSRIQNAKYSTASVMLYFLKTGNSIAAIPIENRPLKLPSNTEVINFGAFGVALIKKSSENKMGPCKN